MNLDRIAHPKLPIDPWKKGGSMSYPMTGKTRDWYPLNEDDIQGYIANGETIAHGPTPVYCAPPPPAGYCEESGHNDHLGLYEKWQKSERARSRAIEKAPSTSSDSEKEKPCILL